MAAPWPVSEAKQKELEARMKKVAMEESTLEEEFVRGSGPGGQKINKTSVAVSLRHRPTGLKVQCQQSRSQALNRYYARKMLVEKLEEQILGKESAKQQEIAKIRRQKRRRSRRAKEKMLADKKRQATKKELRKPPLPE